MMARTTLRHFNIFNGKFVRMARKYLKLSHLHNKDTHNCNENRILLSF